MSDIKEAYPIANQILKKYFLCDSCLRRMFSKKLKLSSNRLLGKNLKKNNFPLSKKCYICKNLFDNLSPHLESMLESSSKYKFSSFVVGSIIQPSIIDRDDYIRSKYKLQGIDKIPSGGQAALPGAALLYPKPDRFCASGPGRAGQSCRRLVLCSQFSCLRPTHSHICICV